MMVKKALTEGHIEVSRKYFADGTPAGVVVIKDHDLNKYFHLYPNEAEFISKALLEILKFTPELP